jgi:hypothetical protein
MSNRANQRSLVAQESREEKRGAAFLGMNEGLGIKGWNIVTAAFGCRVF